MGFDPHRPFAPFYSFDLTSATDRFPISFQREVLGMLIGERPARAWERILVSLPFYVPWTREYVKYRAGQPMGAYTSWVIFALCHHLVVRVAGYHIHKHYNFDQYFILGDDIVIWGDEKVAKEYNRLMSVV